MIESTDRNIMKEIKAIIQPAMLSRVIGALKAMTKVSQLGIRSRAQRNFYTRSVLCLGLGTSCPGPGLPPGVCGRT